MMEELLLVGDAGGTKTILALAKRSGTSISLLSHARYESGRYSGLEEIASDFLAKVDQKIDRASFSVAGPVHGGQATLPNLGWVVEADAVRDRFGLESVELLNDLQATAYGLVALHDQDLEALQPGTAELGSARAVIAPGTGLGEAFLEVTPGGNIAYASEGGNADFAPGDREQIKLLEYLLDRHDHVSVEMVCSGLGIPNIYAFLRDTGAYTEPDWLRDRLARVDDPTPVIVEAAHGYAGCPIAQATVRIFLSILGAEAGNLALRTLATGGVFLAGGIPPRILPWLREGVFLDAFRRKGRFSAFMEMIPVHVVTHPHVALLGAAISLDR